MEFGQKTVPTFNKYAYVYDRKFDLALRETTIDCFRNRYVTNTPTFDDRLIVDHAKTTQIANVDVSNSLYAQILLYIMDNDMAYSDQRHKRDIIVRWVSQAAEGAVKVQYQYCNQCNFLPNRPHNLQRQTQYFASRRIPEFLCKQFHAAKKLENIVTQSSLVNEVGVSKQASKNSFVVDSRLARGLRDNAARFVTGD